MKNIMKKLASASTSMTAVVRPNTRSSVHEDEAILRAFLLNPLSFQVGAKTDDVFDRLIEERLNADGIVQIFRKLIVDSWKKEGGFYFVDSWFCRTIIAANDANNDRHSWASDIMKRFSEAELLEIQAWAANDISELDVIEDRKYICERIFVLAALVEILKRKLCALRPVNS